MSKPRPSKSGSKGRHPARRTVIQRAFSLNEEAHKTLARAIAVSNQFTTGSKLAIETLTRCCVELIQTHGSRICADVLLTVPYDPDKSENLLLAAIRALSQTGDIAEAERIMRDMRMHDMARAEIYHRMGESAGSPEIKERILQALREITALTDSAEVRLYVEYSLFVHHWEHGAALTQNLQLFVQQCYEKPEPLTLFEIDMLAALAPLHPSCDTYSFIFRAVERVTDPATKEHAESQLLRITRLLAKEYLLELADELSGSCYEPRLRELVNTARTIEEMRELKSDSDP